MKFVSPGVYVREIDLSLYIPALSSTIAAMVGTAVKGPVNTRTFVSNVNQFLDIFGNPAENYFMPYAALQYLRRGKQLWVVRVAGASAATAQATIDVMEPAILTSTAGTSTVVTGTANVIKITVADSRSGSAINYVSTITVPAGTYSRSDLASKINDLLAANATLANWVGCTSLPKTGSTEAVSLVGYVADPAVTLTLDSTVANDGSVAMGWTSNQTDTGQDTTKDIILKADSVGSWGNNLRIVITPKKGWKNDISVWEITPTNTTGFRTELLPGVDLFNASGNNNFVGTVAGATESADGRRSTEILYENTSGGTALPAATRFQMLKTGSFTFSGGSDDAGGVTDGSYVGIAEPAATGLQLFRSSDEVDLNLIMVPGITTAPIINEMLSICEERADCMAIIDTPLGYSPQQVVDWHNGAGAFTGDHQAFNSSYGAMYWPWLEIYDAYNDKRIWTPPCGQVSAVYAWTDYIAETWSAPAGHNRAHLTQTLRVQYNATLGERELMYGNQNAINPIVSFPKDGVTIWGQRTLQRAPTALDRVNVRRLLLYLKKVVATASRYLVFEPNDDVTWRQFTRLVTPLMESVKNRRGLYEFAVICDATTNTPFFIDQNTMVGKIFLQPVKTAERIQVDFVITPTGAKFDEILF